MSFSPSSKARLTTRDPGRFPDDSLFHRIARAVCEAGCLPRKELYEAWEMARRVRAVVGRKAVIVGTFDPHANEDKEFLEAADMAFCVKYFPHYDEHLQGERAARMLVRAIRGDYKPATVTIKVPIATPTVMQWTGASPWMDLVQRALVWEAREPDVYVRSEEHTSELQSH